VLAHEAHDDQGMSNPIVQTIAAVGLAGVLYLATVDAINA